ncbi:MAG TPA: CAP domain-containing protein [Candidatus Sulfotelmatobacter sp.]|nr:CAP domain-containing protein [Candidatus Sulfotelmatobacter sp.]
MLGASKIEVALVLVMGVFSAPSFLLMAASGGNADAAQKSAQQATLRPASASSPDIPFSDYDSGAEQLLLELANQSRAQAGAPRLTLDAGMSRAARAHAEQMFAERQLSHQFDGEPSLPQRLAAATSIQLDQEGENVALDFDAEKGHQHLMLSPPHRANLLNPAYNVVGLGVVRSGDRLYIVQDFGHALPNYSPAEVKDKIAAAVLQVRHDTKQPELARRDLSAADAAACSMAQADKLGTSPVHQLAQRYTVLTYTSLHPEALPENASHLLSSLNLHSFSVGTCYSRTETYPTGVYWVVLSLD